MKAPTLRVPSLPHVPVIGYVIAGAAVVVLVSVAAIVVSRDRDQTRRIAAADSTAHDFEMRAVILNRDAKAERARADSATTAATRDHAIADSLRTTLRGLAARAASTSAAVDRTGLRPDVLEALDAADRFRLAVTPTLAADSVDVATWKASAEHWHHAYELEAEAYAEQGGALVATQSELRMVRQQHAPRCSWKCGAAIGGSTVLVVLVALAHLL